MALTSQLILMLWPLWSRNVFRTLPQYSINRYSPRYVTPSVCSQINSNWCKQPTPVTTLHGELLATSLLSHPVTSLRIRFPSPLGPSTHCKVRKSESFRSRMWHQLEIHDCTGCCKFKSVRIIKAVSRLLKLIQEISKTKTTFLKRLLHCLWLHMTS